SSGSSGFAPFGHAFQTNVQLRVCVAGTNLPCTVAGRASKARMYNARTMRHAMTEFSRAKALCSVPFAAAEPRTLTSLAVRRSSSSAAPPTYKECLHEDGD